jgi:hypothetical protein
MTIGLLTASNPALLAEEHRLKLLFLMEGDNAFSINPHKRVNVDVLILLDTGGINCTTSGFYPTFKTPPAVPGQDQWYEAFRVYSLQWYIQKKIPMVGIGTSALLLWDSVLGGKICYEEGELLPVKDDKKALFENGSGRNFLSSHVSGLIEMPDDVDFYRIVHKLYRQRIRDNEALVEELANRPIAPLTRGEHNKVVEEKPNFSEVPEL